MTKLEEEIENALEDAQYGDYDDGDLAKAAAEVAKKYIEKATEFNAGCYGWERGYFNMTFNELRNLWLEENGII